MSDSITKIKHMEEIQNKAQKAANTKKEKNENKNLSSLTIELHPCSNGDTDEIRKNDRIKTWKYIRMLDNSVFKAANSVINHQFYDLMLRKEKEDAVYLNERRVQKINLNKIVKDKKSTKEIKEDAKKKISVLDEEIKEKQALINQEMLDINKTSQQNKTYQIDRIKFPEIPSSITSALNSIICKSFEKVKFEILQGKRSPSFYNKGYPIPFFRDSMAFESSDKIYMNWMNCRFELNFGKDRSGNKEVVKKCMLGEYEFCDSSIQLKDNKIFLKLVVRKPNINRGLDENICVGVDLGIKVPACLALSNSGQRLFLGDIDSFLRVRQQMQYKKWKLQKSLIFVGGGKGRKKKMKAFDNSKQKEKNWVTNYNQKLSSMIVNFAIKNNAGTIKLEFLEGFGKDGKKDVVLRNWSYYQLQNLVEQKAKNNGIKVVYVDPYKTSQTCSCCGSEEEGQRQKQDEFICKNVECGKFDKKVNADYNAAVNIANSNKIVEKKEDCEFFKKKENIMEENLEMPF